MSNWAVTQKVELTQTSQRNQVQAWASVGDRNAHRWAVQVYRGGVEVDITDAVIAGYCVRQDGRTVVLKGTAAWNSAIVDLTQECYAIPGVVKCLMRISKNDETITATYLHIVVEPLIPGEFIDPGEAIPNLEDLFTMATVVLRATEYANTAGDYANTQGDYAKAQGSNAAAQAAYAKAQGDYAKQEADRVKGAVDLAYDENAVLILHKMILEIQEGDIAEINQHITNIEQSASGAASAAAAAKSAADAAQKRADAAYALANGKLTMLVQSATPSSSQRANTIWVDTSS